MRKGKWKLLLIFVLFFFGASSVLEASLGQSINTAWDPVDEEYVIGYRVYCGTSSRNYTTVVDVGNNTSHLTTHLIDGQTYYIAVKAYNSLGDESEVYSDEIVDTPGKPGKFRAWRQAINELWGTAKKVMFNS